jgi:branched-chain amino acid transport system permease protein
VFSLTVPLFVIVMSVLGGRAHWLGPVIGAVLIVMLQERLTTAKLAEWRLIVLGAILVLLVVVAPGGLYGRLRARPRATAVAFAVTVAALAIVRLWGEFLDWLVLGMLVAAVVAVWPTRSRSVEPTAARVEPEETVPGPASSGLRSAGSEATGATREGDASSGPGARASGASATSRVNQSAGRGRHTPGAARRR